MDALFNKIVNIGVGYLSQGTRLVQATVEKLVEENKLSEQEGQKIVADLLKSGETKRADLEKQFKKLTTDLRTRVGLAGEEQSPFATAKPATKAGAAKKPANSPPAKAAGIPKKTAAKTQHAAAVKAGAAKKEAGKE